MKYLKREKCYEGNTIPAQPFPINKKAQLSQYLFVCLFMLWASVNFTCIFAGTPFIMVYLAIFSTTIDKILCFMGPHKIKMSHYF